MTAHERMLDDIEFAREDGQFNTSQLLRYVAALNLDATREQFVAACVEAGYRANSAANRFRESRAIMSNELGG